MQEETGETYASRILDEHKELVDRWTKEQIALREQLIFLDNDLSFSVNPSPRDCLGTPLADLDVPDVHAVRLSQLGPHVRGLNFVGGLDISFVSEEGEGSRTTQDGNAPEPDAFATLVVIEFPSLRPLHVITHPIRLEVPYIPTFLSYREAPAYLALIQDLRTKLANEGREHEFPQVFLVDGNGRLHIRECGVASVVGVQADVPTIGVAKSFLPHHPERLAGEMAAKMSGHWRSSQHGMREMIRLHLRDNGSWFGLYNAAGDDYAGAAVIPPSSKTPLFVSSGHRISLVTAIYVTLLLAKYRIPEPIRLADHISRAAASRKEV